jgi:putative addiction module component (TIGR02574 family)
MTASSELYTQALCLPPVQREELAMLLLDSLPDDDDLPIRVSEELEQEIERRIAEHQAGTAKTVDITSFIAAVRAAAKPCATP